MSDEKCSDKHDILYHYTTMDGFHGIMETQTLWATHYRHLNDSSELARFTAILPDFLTPTVKRVIKEFRAEGRAVKQAIRQAGSIHNLARREASILADAFYQGAFTSINEHTAPMFEPFITSFCSHLKDDDYIREHGLLSMWRSYGSGGGVAIVLDTLELENLLKGETSEYGHIHLQIGDVVYEGDIEAFNSEFGSLINLTKEKTYQYFKEANVKLGDFLTPFLSCVARFKHRAFQEEREVRIVTIPWNERLKHTEPRAEKVKPEHSRTGNSCNIRYLALFDGESSPRLPILKIIVGPHREQKERFEKICKATKHLPHIKVTCSETPFIER